MTFHPDIDVEQPVEHVEGHPAVIRYVCECGDMFVTWLDNGCECYMVVTRTGWVQDKQIIRNAVPKACGESAEDDEEADDMDDADWWKNGLDGPDLT